MLHHIRYLIGNGNSTEFWLDPWLPCGRLVAIYGNRVVYDLRLGRNVKVTSIIRDGSWCFPHAPNHVAREIF